MESFAMLSPSTQTMPAPGFCKRNNWRQKTTAWQKGNKSARQFRHDPTKHYLGHRSIASTARYTALAPDRFKDFWKD